jgi:hypothetical protein
MVPSREGTMRVKLVIASLVTVAVSVVAAGAATAALPLTQSRPFQAVCEAQGGTLNPSNESFIFCEKVGIPAFSPTQLAVQQTVCEHVYGGSFSVIFVTDPLPFPFPYTATLCTTA